MREEEFVKLSELAEKSLPCISPELFVLKINYTISDIVENSSGKWPDALGNGFYTDSKYLLHDFLNAFKNAFLQS